MSADDVYMITEAGEFDARLNPYIKKLQNDSSFVPAGSTLRITMEDRTTFIVTTAEDFKIQARVDRPQWNSNKTPHFRVRVTAELEYFLSADALATLTAKPAINMRLETTNRYYTFGHRNMPYKKFAWAPKVNLTIQKALNCVL